MLPTDIENIIYDYLIDLRKNDVIAELNNFNKYLLYDMFIEFLSGEKANIDAVREYLSIKGVFIVYKNRLHEKNFEDLIYDYIEKQYVLHNIKRVGLLYKLFPKLKSKSIKIYSKFRGYNKHRVDNYILGNQKSKLTWALEYSN